MQDVLDYCHRMGFAGVRLVQAAFHNRSLSLYAKLGFMVREPLATIQGPAVKEKIPGYDVRTASEDDVEACNALCVRVHGHARETEVREAIRQSTASVVVRNGRLTGYATMSGYSGMQSARQTKTSKL